jgi:hypothetical protein
MDNAHSLEHLFVALRRRLRRLVQAYDAKNVYQSLRICARVLQSYASYTLNSIDEFSRRLHKDSNDYKRLLNNIDQFRVQLAELRHCHSTFEVELLVTILAMDFHENDLNEQQPSPRDGHLPLSTGRFSPRSRFSKYRVRQIRHAIELKSQLKQTNENLRILLYDEFNANLSHLWDESERYLSALLPFHDHHMTYVLRLIPDVALKFECALQICAKLFDLETTMVNVHKQIDRRQDKSSHRFTSELTMTDTPRSDFNVSQHDIRDSIDYQRLSAGKYSRSPPKLVSVRDTSLSSIGSVTKAANSGTSQM